MSWDPSTARLVMRPRDFEALVGDAPDRAVLEAAGVLVDGRPHPALEPALAAVHDPVCRLEMTRGDRHGRGWVGPQSTALLVPAGDERLELVTVPTPFLADALARMNDVAPRPRVEPAARLRQSAGELAAALAARDPALLALAGGIERKAAASLMRTLREHWRVEARWAPSPESPGVRVVEAIDTADGVWLVVPDGDSVELWPSTPTTVFRLLAGLLPRDHELART